MAGYISLLIDKDPPAGVSLRTVGNSTEVDTLKVELILEAEDYLNGQQDITHMKVYGSGVLPSTFGYNTIVPYRKNITIYLYPGEGSKEINAVVYDSHGNESDEQTLTLNYTLASVNRVHILNQTHVHYTGSSGQNKYPGIWWMAEQDFDEYQVCLVSNINDSYEDATPLTTSMGTNIYDHLLFPQFPTQAIGSSINIPAMLASSTFSSLISGAHIFKVFVRNQGGEWYS